MTEPSGDWAQTIVHLLAIADRLEGHGQLNNAKLARAAADALTRRAAYSLNLPRDPDDNVSDLNHLLVALPGLGLSEELASAMSRGAAAMAANRLPLHDEIPHPFVCRTCGELTLAAPDAPCATCGAWPTTFQQFQPVYWLDDLHPREALSQLEAAPAIIASLLEGLDEEHLSRTPADGGWAMRQIVAHIRDAEAVLHSRLGLMTAQENPILESLAVFAWATSEENRPPTTAELFQTYRESRRETVAILKGLAAWDWWRTGRHKEFGMVTILQQASYFSAHEQTHFAGLTALRNAATP